MKYYFLLILLIPSAIAQEINFFKPEYTPGETVQGEVINNLNIVGEITNGQIQILDSFGDKRPILVNIIKVNDNYYLFYFDASIAQSGAYTLNIKDILYLENNILKTTSFEKQFYINQKNYNVLSLQPEAIYFKSDENVFQAVRVSNLENYATSLALESTELIIPSINQLQIPGLSSKIFYIYIQSNKAQTGLYFYQLAADYQLPVYLVTTQQPIQSAPEPSCMQNWQCSSWSSCNSNGIQTRTCNDINNCDLPCTSNLCLTAQTCAPATCTPNWQCSNWSSCIGGAQTRYCSDLNNCNPQCYDSSCSEIRSCTSVCNQNWDCSQWALCNQATNQETRTCTDINNCNLPCYDQSCLEARSCTALCSSNWQCSSWSSCNSNGIQTRTCNDINNCNLPCTSSSCLTAQVCLPEKEEPELEKKTEIQFFSDLSHPEITVNTLANENIPEKQMLQGPLYIKNTGETELKNIVFSLTGNLNDIIRLNKTNQSILAQGEVLYQYIWINENKNPMLDEYRGSLIFTADGFSKEFPIYLLIEKEETTILEESEPRTLFIEEQSKPLTELETQEPVQEQDKTPAKVEFPYKQVAFVLLILLIILIYFISKRPTRKKTSFQEYVAKIEKR